MKKVSVIVGVIGFIVVLGLVGCGEKTKSPEDVARIYVSEKFQGIACDLTDLDFKKVEKGKESVQVRVKGKIKYEEVVTIVKENGKWVVAQLVEETTDPAEPEAVMAPEKAGH